MTSHRYANALSLAAQATMCVMKKTPVLKVQLDQETLTSASKNQLLHLPAKYWQDNVWITLSGSVTRAIHEGRGESNLFLTEDVHRYEKALNLCYELVSPKVPAQLKDLLRFDPRQTVKHVYLGNYPQGVHGHLKGSLTRYCKSSVKRQEFAEEMLNKEIYRLFTFIKNSETFMGIAYMFAEELSEHSTLDAEDVIDLYGGSYVQMRKQSSLQQLIRLAA